MHEPRQYDSTPIYSGPYSLPSQIFYAQRGGGVLPYPHARPAAPDSCCYYEGGEGADGARPQLFHRWCSPPGVVRALQGSTVLLCFLVFLCLASTLVWDAHGAAAGAGAVGVPGASGYYGYSHHVTPYSAKGAMIAAAALNFIAALGFLVGSFSRTGAARGRSFYLAMVVVDIVLACLQGIIDIIFVIGVNPMSQSSHSMMFNPMLTMCLNVHGSPGLSSPGGLLMYNQYLRHYCIMDPEEAVALVLGLMVVLLLSLAAFYAYKTRSKIWRHGKHNIYWDPPFAAASDGRDIQDWVNRVGEGRSTKLASTVVLSERATPGMGVGNSAVSYGNRTVSIHSEGDYHANLCSRGPWLLCRSPGGASSSSDEADSIQKTPQQADLGLAGGSWGPRASSPSPVRSQREAGHTTEGNTGNELGPDQTDLLHRMYPEITSDQHRRRYRVEFASELARYKSLCAEMDDISDQINKLGQELDALDENSKRYQGVADEYNRVKDLKRTPEYQEKKRQSIEIRQKLFHIKRLVKNFDSGLC